ncbi:MAG: hypothetical protein KDA50_03960, partial [Rhodobacteraceae bacterium]|nr:hypothetical protein [Paracoccaceae bacterium]
MGTLHSQGADQKRRRCRPAPPGASAQPMRTTHGCNASKSIVQSQQNAIFPSTATENDLLQRT